MAIRTRVRGTSTGRALNHQRDGSIRRIAEERIDLLLRLAGQTARSDSALSKRYVEMARRIAMRSGVRLGRERKHFICKECGSALVPGVNCRVRVRSDRETSVVVTCLACGSRKRYPVVKEKRQRRER